jgi:hypothetical protein
MIDLYAWPMPDAYKVSIVPAEKRRSCPAQLDGKRRDIHYGKTQFEKR